MVDDPVKADAASPGAGASPRTGPAGHTPDHPGQDGSLPETVIERRRGWQLLDVRELWRYRELLLILTWRDIQVRYKQSVLGASWAVLQPLATMVVFSLFFGRLAEMPSGGLPYPLFVFAGLLPWFFFQGAITSASQSIIGNHNLVTKVYFPRLLIPFSAVGAPLVDLGVALGLMALMMLGYGVGPGWSILLAPLVVLLLVVAAVAVGTLLAALTVAYRDFKHVVPFGVQLWMFATPSIYLQPELIGPTGQAWLPLNPAFGLIATFRAVMFSGEVAPSVFLMSAAVSVGLLVVALSYFRRVERGFADII
jgi:lipopolysaccharide transport system permease protein